MATHIDNPKCSDCIGVRLLRRSIRGLEIIIENIESKDEAYTTMYQNTKAKLNKKIKELEDLGYEHIEGWSD